MSVKKEKEYFCPWCGHIFKAVAGVSGKGEGQQNKVSSQISCPRCLNFIKTWISNIERNVLLKGKT